MAEAPDDPRITHEPDIPVALSSVDFFDGHDPILRAAIVYEPVSSRSSMLEASKSQTQQ